MVEDCFSEGLCIVHLHASRGETIGDVHLHQSLFLTLLLVLLGQLVAFLVNYLCNASGGISVTVELVGDGLYFLLVHLCVLLIRHDLLMLSIGQGHFALNLLFHAGFLFLFDFYI